MLHRIASRCIEESHSQLVQSGSLVADVRQELSTSPLMPWGVRMDVQGSRLPLGANAYEKDTINGMLCLLRGPRDLKMGDHWIGIVRHDETSYMTGSLVWLVRHVTGRGKKRQLLFAKDHRPEMSYDAETRDGVWDQDKVHRFNRMIH